MKQKTILITGTSSGFGKLAVPLLLQRGHTVLAGLRGGEKRLAEVFSQQVERFPNTLRAVDLHMDKPDSFGAVSSLVSQAFGGRLDVLVNNAGYGLFGALDDQSPEQLRYQFEVNFFGPMLLTRICMPALRAARGRVINVSSICGLVSFPLYGAYCATKHAMEASTEAMHYDFKSQGIQVALLEPGGHRTDFSGRSRAWGEKSFDPQSFNRARCEALQETFNRSNARMGNPMTVARKIVSLCEREKIPLRTIVGADARFMSALRKWLPDSWRVAFEDLLFRKAVFRS